MTSIGKNIKILSFNPLTMVYIIILMDLSQTLNKHTHIPTETLTYCTCEPKILYKGRPSSDSGFGHVG